MGTDNIDNNKKPYDYVSDHYVASYGYLCFETADEIFVYKKIGSERAID